MVAMLMCTACNRDVKKVAGDYSYKLSGMVTFTSGDGDTKSILVNKQGQMNIVESPKGEKGAVVVTFNEMNGGAYSCTGTVSRNNIELDPHVQNMQFSSLATDASLIQLNRIYTVVMKGRGVIQDETMIVEESWSGRPQNDSAVELNAEKVTLLAEKN